MVGKSNSIYVFIGEDSVSKDSALLKIRRQFIPKEIESFNQDVLYTKEFGLKELQERLLCLPIKAKKRILVVKNSEGLPEDIQQFLLRYARKPSSGIILVLDMLRRNPKDQFIYHLSRFAQIYHFKESPRVDTFVLSRQIGLRKADYALKILNQLLSNGEKPERILGGLRYTWEKDAINPQEKRRRLKFILNCDIDIKTGRLKPTFALERMVARLCCF